jgi:hypothetical protein
MNDTPESIRHKQFEIIYSKPLSEKLKGLFEMTELSMSIIENQITRKHPELTKNELKAKLFEAFYSSDFDKSTIAEITNELKAYWEKQAKQ